MSEPLAILTFNNVPPDRYIRIQQAASTHGLTITGDAGTDEDKGVTVGYRYNGSSLLTIWVIKVPRIFGHDVISPQAVLNKVQTAIAGIA